MHLASARLSSAAAGDIARLVNDHASNFLERADTRQQESYKGNQQINTGRNGMTITDSWVVIRSAGLVSMPSSLLC